MASVSSSSSSSSMDAQDPESSTIPTSYAPLLHPDSLTSPTAPNRKSSSLLPVAGGAVIFLLCLAALIASQCPGQNSEARSDPASDAEALSSLSAASRGPAAGVSEKSESPWLRSTSAPFPWTNNMLFWQRTSFHFQTEKNWMNDPDGPLYYKGWYHLFYQYNPDSAVWGNITWGHAVSRDLVHWLYLPLAMVPDRWYDINGVWTGSATFLPDGRIAMLYTGATADAVQVQNLAFPADPDDPLLLNWTKHDANPVLVPPAGIGKKDFRDPTTAWYVKADSSWRFAIGSKNDSDGHTGVALVYRTKDFLTYELLPGVLHSVAGTGMWECVDFYPVSTDSATGLDTSTEPGPRVKHVLKESSDDDRHDWYAIGTYSVEDNSWTPDDAEKDVGVGLRYDYGKFYASKTFYDTARGRRLLWGWIGETDSERTDLQKGWASLQAIPRTVLFDQKTGSNLLQWPVEEVESLRTSGQEFADIKIAPGFVVPLNVSHATELDIVAEFAIDKSALELTTEADVGYNCSTSGGAAGRGALGPFGFLVLAADDLSEQTAVYFYVAKGTDGSVRTFFCQDELRSSLANDIVKRVYGSIVPVLDGESLSVRILLDHSIAESYAQGGRTCVTSRLYPTRAINGGARLLLFNNASAAGVTAKSLKVWQMDSANIRPYFDQGSGSRGFSPAAALSFALLSVVAYLYLLVCSS